MLAVILTYQQVENNILTPKIQGKAVNLSAFFIIIVGDAVRRPPRRPRRAHCGAGRRDDPDLRAGVEQGPAREGRYREVGRRTRRRERLKRARPRLIGVPYDRPMSETPPRASIGYVGHATVLIDLGGVRLLTDPLLRNRVAHLRRNHKIDADSLRGVDAVLISHLHYDHLDLPSLQRLGRDMPVVAPHGAGALIRRKAAVKNVVELREGEQIEIGALTVRATHANHDSGRMPLGVKAEPIGYVIEGAGRSVYFAGDTDVFPEMTALRPIDVALLPIWGWGPTMGPGHMDPQRAAEAAALLGARVAIPIHWGTYYPVHLGLQGSPGFLTAPPAAFDREIRSLSPSTEVRVLAPGETSYL